MMIKSDRITYDSCSDKHSEMTDLQMFEICFEQALNPVAILDLQFNFLRVNRAYAEAGKTQGDYFCGKNHFALYPDDDNKRIFEMVRDTGQPYRATAKAFEYKEHPEWGISYWDWTLSPVKDAAGQVRWLVLSLINVTDKILAQDEVASLSHFRAAVIETADVWLAVTDAKGIVLVWNRAAELISGYSREEVISEQYPWTQLYPDIAYHEKIIKKTEALLKNEKESLSFESVICTKSGQLRNILWNSRCLKINGVTNGIVSLGRDVTDQKLAGQKLREYQLKVRRLNSEVSLAEERVRRKVAMDLHDGIGQLLAVSKLKINILQQAEDCPENKNYLDEIIEHLESAIGYTRSLTAELSPPALHEFGFEAAVEWLCEHVQSNHKLKCRLDRSAVKMNLKGNTSILLFQVVRELVFNAVKHARASNLEVKLFKDDERIQISVKDDGIGFDPGRAAKGSMGLFNVRERLEHLSGEVEITSRLGHGTTITIWVPIQERGEGNGYKDIAG